MAVRPAATFDLGRRPVSDGTPRPGPVLAHRRAIAGRAGEGQRTAVFYRRRRGRVRQPPQGRAHARSARFIRASMLRSSWDGNEDAVSPETGALLRAGGRR